MTKENRTSPEGNTPHTGSAKGSRKPTIAALRAGIAAHGCATVYVTKDYAPAFRKPPRDGNTYIVEDPQRRGVLHWTDPEGRYRCLIDPAPHLRIKVGAKRAKGARMPAVDLVRRVESVASAAPLQSVPDTDPLPIRLIKLERVMQITGFGKSFLYEQADFPKPAKLGTAKRAAVRWNEAEVIAWVRNLLAQRGE